MDAESSAESRDPSTDSSSSSSSDEGERGASSESERASESDTDDTAVPAASDAAERVLAIARLRTFVARVPDTSEHTVALELESVNEAERTATFVGENAVFATEDALSAGLEFISVSRGDRVLFERAFRHVQDVNATVTNALDPVHGGRAYVGKSRLDVESGADVKPNRFGERPTHRVDRLVIAMDDVPGDRERARLWGAVRAAAGTSGVRA